MISDKEQVRDYVAKKIGSEYLIPLLWKGVDPETIPFDSLPAKYVIKATHGCGYNVIVKDNSKVDRHGIMRQLKKWLATNYAEDFAIGIEWGYRNIRPAIIIEPFIGENDKQPEDFKFFCFFGRVEFVTLHFDRYSLNHKLRSFDRNFQEYEIRFELEQYIGEYPCPSNFDDMVRVAEVLAHPFGFMRVDLYNVNGRAYFGELTPYHGGVTTIFTPASLDESLGRKWQGK
jgi:hypothetical protein